MHKLSLSSFFLFYLSLKLCFATLTQLTVTIGDSTINSISTHTWSITYNNSISRRQFSLTFPSCVLPQPNAYVSIAGTTASITTILANTIDFTLASALTATNYVFVVGNVKNCFRAISTKSFFVYNREDNLVETPLSMIIVKYIEGTLTNCQLNFLGSTGSVPSNLHIDFKIQNSVQGSTFQVRVQYPTYFSSSLQVSSYNNINNSPYFVAECQLSSNGTLLSANSVSASITFVNKSLLCPFVLPSGTTISPSDSLRLTLTNILNPKTTSIYASNTDFILTTLDGSWFSYDKSSACTPNVVALSQINAAFSQSQLINGNMYPILLATTIFVPIAVDRNDRILLRYTKGQIVNCSGRIFVDKSSGSSPMVFNEQPTNINQAKLYLSDGSSDANNTLTIEFEGCSFSMPPSTLPVQFSLVFSGTGATVGAYDDYMQINAQLVPLPATLLASQVALSLSVATIGDLSTYTFGITTRQPLSQTPTIAIDFPAQVSITASIPTLSSCSVAVGSLGIGSKSCQFAPPNSILVNLTNTDLIAAGTRIQISIPNVRNPSSPTSVSGFNIRTYYTFVQPAGLVETGTNVIAAQLYVARKIYPQIANNSFTVYTENTIVTILYPVGVDLPSGSVTTLAFTNELKNLAFVDAIPSSVALSRNSSIVFEFILPSIAAGTTITFTFSCLTPQKTGIYSIVEILTKAATQEYEKTESPVTLQVTQPHANTFAVSPSTGEAITGKSTVYTFYFQSVVPHPNLFILEVSFPSGTNLVNGQSSCLSGCNSTANFSDTSSGLLDRVQLIVKTPSAGCSTCFEVKVGMVINQREVGSTGTFNFRTMTLGRQLIVFGSKSATINSPNSLSAALVAADDYYRGNTSPVHVQINLTNKLEPGDMVIMTFQSNTYTPGGVVGCAEGNCTGALVNAVDYQLKAIPTSNQVIQMTLNFQIYGLVSSPTTLYGEIFSISVGTFSSAGRAIDNGSMAYSVDCGDSQFSKNCRTCSTISGQQVCTSCYTPTYSLYNNSLCTNACGNESQYETYPSSGVCVACTPPCFSCFSSTNCSTCIPGFYLIVAANLCLPNCSVSNGYYSVSSNGFLYCKTCTEPNCKSCPIDVCDACMANWALLDGKCQDGCAPGTFNAGGVCSRCNQSCLTCDGPLNTNCFNCSLDYYEVDGQCTRSCPEGKVSLQDGICGCSGDCSSCVDRAEKCLSCLNALKYYYDFGCYDQCPTATYALGQSCMSCSSGCLRCSSTTCVECLNGYSIFENKCYFDCKQVGPRFAKMAVSGVMRCEECPDGCSDCNPLYECTQCLSGYVQNGTVCKRACETTNTCDLTPKIDPIVPLPGFLAFAIWTIVVVMVKIFLIKTTYVPYTLIFGGALIQFVLLAVTLGSVDVKIRGTARLLQYAISSEVQTSLGLLAVSLGLNYLMNLVALWVFCRCIRPMILPRQVDKISNYAVLALSLVTNYRFYLLAFSRLFKKPSIEVKDPQKLRSLHIILGVSSILDAVPFVAVILLVLNTDKLSILYMLAIDLLLLICALWIVFLWVLLRPKPQEYYSETKKFSLQENHITEQGSMHNNQKDLSKAKIHNLTNQQLQVEEYLGEEATDNLQTKQANVIRIGKKDTESIQASEDNSAFRTRRKGKGIESVQAESEHKIKPLKNEGINSKPKGAMDFEEASDSGAKSNQLGHKDKARPERVIQGVQMQGNDETKGLPNDESEAREKKVAHYKSTKIKGARSSTLKIEQGQGMSKKNKPSMFESEVGDSNIEDVDLQSIIQSKLVDRSKERQTQRGTRTEAGGNDDTPKHFEQISPSWFNMQNQRYDLEDKQLQ